MDRLIKAMDKLLEVRPEGAKKEEKREDRSVADNKTARTDPKMKKTETEPSKGGTVEREKTSTTDIGTAHDSERKPKSKVSGASLRQIGRLLFSTEGRISRLPFWSPFL